MRKITKISLIGNHNSGKTTLFNALTGLTSFDENRQSVEREIKHGILKSDNSMEIEELSGVNSLNSYDKNEIEVKNHLISSMPDVILNVLDHSNPERSLYLTLQLIETGIPVVVALNKTDLSNTHEGVLNHNKLSFELGCDVVKISAIRDEGLTELSKTLKNAAEKGMHGHIQLFSDPVERALTHIEITSAKIFPPQLCRWYAIRLFERDDHATTKIFFDERTSKFVEKEISDVEMLLKNDSCAILSNERHMYVEKLLKRCYIKKYEDDISISDKIDRVVTNKYAALPLFAVIIFLMYFLSVTLVGMSVTDWTGRGQFGEGRFLLRSSAEEYAKALVLFEEATATISAFEKRARELGISPDEGKNIFTIAYVFDENGNMRSAIPVTYESYLKALEVEEPRHSDYGIWIGGIASIFGDSDSNNNNSMIKDLLLNGLLPGLCALLIFLPQLIVMFIILAFLEECGYMSRISFLLDKILRKLGLSGKYFKILDARLAATALVMGVLFYGEWWAASSVYFTGIIASALLGFILKKHSQYAGDSPIIIIDLPKYHIPGFKTIARSVKRRCAFLLKTVTPITIVSSICIWAVSNFGWENGIFGSVEKNNSILAAVSGSVSFIFNPLGWSDWESIAATIAGSFSKANIISTLGILKGSFDGITDNRWQLITNIKDSFTPLSGMSFVIFNIICAPCFAIFSEVKREMKSIRLSLLSIMYQSIFAYIIALILNQVGMLFNGEGNMFVLLAITSIIIIISCFALWRRQRAHDFKTKLS